MFALLVFKYFNTQSVSAMYMEVYVNVSDLLLTVRSTVRLITVRYWKLLKIDSSVRRQTFSCGERKMPWCIFLTLGIHNKRCKWAVTLQCDIPFPLLVTEVFIINSERTIPAITGIYFRQWKIHCRCFIRWKFW